MINLNPLVTLHKLNRLFHVDIKSFDSEQPWMWYIFDKAVSFSNTLLTKVWLTFTCPETQFSMTHSAGCEKSIHEGFIFAQGFRSESLRSVDLVFLHFVPLIRSKTTYRSNNTWYSLLPHNWCRTETLNSCNQGVPAWWLWEKNYTIIYIYIYKLN